MYLEGPVTLRYMTRGDSAIALLGEYHFSLRNLEFTEQLCPRDGVTPVLNVSDYLDVLFSTAPKQRFDLFAEITSPTTWERIRPALAGPASEARAALFAFHTAYGACIERKATCLFPNVRFHYTDWRPDRYFEDSNRLFESYYLEEDAERVATLLLLMNVTPTEYQKQILAFPPIHKQLLKTNATVAELIMADLEALRKMAQMRLVTVDVDPNGYIISMMDMWAAIMDYYLLARLFKPETSNNVIIYGGDAHRVHIAKLLKQLGYTTQVAVGAPGPDDIPPLHCLKIDKGPGFFFAPLADHPPLTKGYVELFELLSRPSFTFETSWYASEFNIIRLMAIYFKRQTNVALAYTRMHAATGTTFTFQRVKDTLALFVHNSSRPLTEPAIANKLLLESRQALALEDASVRALFIYKDAYVRLSPIARFILKLLISNTVEPPASNLLVLLEIKQSG